MHSDMLKWYLKVWSYFLFLVLFWFWIICLKLVHFESVTVCWNAKIFLSIHKHWKPCLSKNVAEPLLRYNIWLRLDQDLSLQIQVFLQLLKMKQVCSQICKWASECKLIVESRATKMCRVVASFIGWKTTLCCTFKRFRDWERAL